MFFHEYCTRVFAPEYVFLLPSCNNWSPRFHYDAAMVEMIAMELGAHFLAEQVRLSNSGASDCGRS